MNQGVPVCSRCIMDRYVCVFVCVFVVCIRCELCIETPELQGP